MFARTAAVFGFLLAVPSGAPNAQLTIEARTGTATSVLRVSSATLECDGTAEATGFLRGAGRDACTATGDGVVGTVVAAQRQARICSEQYGGPQTARITGTINGKRVTVRVARSDGCGIADWEMLRPLLGDPERRGRIPRRSRTTGPSVTTPPVAYQVQRGDTLTVIARRFRTTVRAITERNQITDPDSLAEGQTLVIPEPSSLELVATLLGAGERLGVRAQAHRRGAGRGRHLHDRQSRWLHLHRHAARRVARRRGGDHLQDQHRARGLRRRRRGRRGHERGDPLPRRSWTRLGFAPWKLEVSTASPDTIRRASLSSPVTDASPSASSTPTPTGSRTR